MTVDCTNHVWSVSNLQRYHVMVDPTKISHLYPYFCTWFGDSTKRFASVRLTQACPKALNSKKVRTPVLMLYFLIEQLATSHRSESIINWIH